MAGQHGARQQKRVAKQKAKKSAKRAVQLRRSSSDPTVRLAPAEKWQVVQALMAEQLWDNGIGYLTIARRDSEGMLVFAAYLVDVYCLGVKNTFWQTGTKHDYKELVDRLETNMTMRLVTPAYLAKLVTGAVEYARNLGFSPHPDYRHSSRLLAGIDASACPEEFTFGRDGKPFYIQGPNESVAEAAAIARHIQAAGGLFTVGGPAAGLQALPGTDDDWAEDESRDDDADFAREPF